MRGAEYYYSITDLIYNLLAKCEESDTGPLSSLSQMEIKILREGNIIIWSVSVCVVCNWGQRPSLSPLSDLFSSLSLSRAFLAGICQSWFITKTHQASGWLIQSQSSWIKSQSVSVTSLIKGLQWKKKNIGAFQVPPWCQFRAYYNVSVRFYQCMEITCHMIW